jgi:hypothetical protein
VTATIEGIVTGEHRDKAGSKTRKIWERSAVVQLDNVDVTDVLPPPPPDPNLFAEDEDEDEE